MIRRETNKKTNKKIYSIQRINIYKNILNYLIVLLRGTPFSQSKKQNERHYYYRSQKEIQIIQFDRYQ